MDFGGDFFVRLGDDLSPTAMEGRERVFCFKRIPRRARIPSSPVSGTTGRRCTDVRVLPQEYKLIHLLGGQRGAGGIAVLAGRHDGLRPPFCGLPGYVRARKGAPE